MLAGPDRYWNRGGFEPQEEEVCYEKIGSGLDPRRSVENR